MSAQRQAWFRVRVHTASGQEFFDCRVPMSALSETISLAGRIADNYARGTPPADYVQIVVQQL